MGRIASLQVVANAHTRPHLNMMYQFLKNLFFSNYFATNELQKLSPNLAKEADLNAVKKPW